VVLSSRSIMNDADEHALTFQADLAAARDAEVEAKRRLVEEAESAARQAAAQVDTASQLDRVQVMDSSARGRLCAPPCFSSDGIMPYAEN
jgi:hypothetical protein